MVVLGSLSQIKPSPIPTNSSSSSSNPSQKGLLLTRRRAIVLGPSVVVASLLHFYNPISPQPSSHLALAQQQQEDELQQQEDRSVHLFQETSPSVVFIKDLEIDKSLKASPDAVFLSEDGNSKVEGTGSGFIWDKFGHIVTNYHVVAKLATDQTGLQRCKVYLVDARGNGFYSEGKIVGVDPAYDLAVLKVFILLLVALLSSLLLYADNFQPLYHNLPKTFRMTGTILRNHCIGVNLIS
ncbi:unnamed protein product [Prunus armeniaca]